MCPIGFLMLGSPCKTCRAIRPPHADQPAAGGELAAHRLPPTNHPRVHPAYLVGHAVELATAPPPPTTTARSKPTPRLAQHRLRQLRARGSDSGRRRAGPGRSGDHADPGHPSRTAACPTAALQDLTSAGHSGRRNAQTPDAHTGRPHRTPDSGHLDAQTPAPDTGHRPRWTGKRGHWSLAPDTRHWTLAEDVDTLTKARPASGPPGPPRQATARWDAQPRSRGRRLQRSAAHAGSAMRPPSSARSRLAGSCLAAPPGSSGASAHCSPKTITGRA